MSAREIIYRNDLSSVLLEVGFNVFLPVFDDGIDLIAHRPVPAGVDEVLLIQQKSRWTVARKYVGRGITLAFPDRGSWYLVPHDDMFDWPEVAGYLRSKSWLEAGQYYTPSLSHALAERCAPFAKGPCTVKPG